MRVVGLSAFWVVRLSGPRASGLWLSGFRLLGL